MATMTTAPKQGVRPLTIYTTHLDHCHEDAHQLLSVSPVSQRESPVLSLFHGRS